MRFVCTSGCRNLDAYIFLISIFFKLEGLENSAGKLVGIQLKLEDG